MCQTSRRMSFTGPELLSLLRKVLACTEGELYRLAPDCVLTFTVWRILNSVDLISGCGNGCGGRCSRGTDRWLSLLADQYQSIRTTPMLAWYRKMISLRMKSIRRANFHQTTFMSSFSCNTSSFVRSWDSSCHNSTRWHAKLEEQTLSISLTAIWLWPIGFRTAREKFTGSVRDITSGRRCFMQITSMALTTCQLESHANGFSVRPCACSIEPICHRLLPPTTITQWTWPTLRETLLSRPPG